MERNAERSAAPAVGDGVGVGDGPGKLGAGICAEARAGEERAELFEGQAEGERCGERVGGGERGEFLPADVPGRDGECGELRRRR